MEQVARRPVNIQFRLSRIAERIRAEAPSFSECTATIGSALLLVLAFPNFGYFPLAWISLVPLLVIVARRPAVVRSFLLGCAYGVIFFYVSCYWLTYSMIHFGGLPTSLAYLLLIPAALVVGLFPGLFAFFIAILIRRWGSAALLTSPLIWSTCEWARLEITGQLWNAVGYSQAEAVSGLLIQSAKWGGVYLVGALVVAVNAAIAFLILNRSRRGLVVSLAMLLLVVFVVTAGARTKPDQSTGPYLSVIAIQPNVPMSFDKTDDDLKELFKRHLSMTSDALKGVSSDHLPTLVIWPESPMNFSYATDSAFRDAVTGYAAENHASILFNSLEPAPDNGAHNSALLINEDGRLIAQYDKIRLMPFGEYVPLPHWLPGASLISGLVGDFSPGGKYVLMPIAGHRAGAFICIESAYPNIARQFVAEGADFLINISNDGYLGPTAVMKQHLANAVFRAVENGRPLLSVTNSGLTAFIRPDGVIEDRTSGFETAVRTWRVSQHAESKTFYTNHGDLFVKLAAITTVVILLISLFAGRRSFEIKRWTII